MTATEPSSINFDKFKDRLVKVEKVEINGLLRTQPAVVMRELSSIDGASLTLEELIEALDAAHNRISSLGIFDAVDFQIGEGVFSPQGCSIRMKVRESSLIQVHSGTYIQGGLEASAEASLNLNNRFGWAEQISFTADYGTRKTNQFAISLTVPRPKNTSSIFDFRIYQNIADRQFLSSYLERMRGLSASITTEDGRHSLSYVLGWLRLQDPLFRASASVMEHLGDHMKSSIRYNFRHNALDDMVFPRKGWSVSLSSEVGGLGMGRLAHFVRQQATGQMAFPVGTEAALHLEGTLGSLLSLGGGKSAHITDRFFVGGVCNEGLRGMKYLSFGPFATRRKQTENGLRNSAIDIIGGDLCLSALAALRFPLPGRILREHGVKGQLFVNCGHLSLKNSTRSFGDISDELRKWTRFSIGCGIVWPLPIGKLELTWARLLHPSNRDSIARGLQFGFTTYF